MIVQTWKFVLHLLTERHMLISQQQHRTVTSQPGKSAHQQSMRVLNRHSNQALPHPHAPLPLPPPPPRPIITHTVATPVGTPGGSGDNVTDDVTAVVIDESSDVTTSREDDVRRPSTESFASTTAVEGGYTDSTLSYEVCLRF